MTIQMQAAKAFRLKLDKGFTWIAEGQPYEVADDRAAQFHEKTGRGKRMKSTKPAKKGD